MLKENCKIGLHNKIFYGLLAGKEEIMDKHITAPISDEDAKELRAGDYVYITGTIYTARDAAHKRMAEALAAGEPLPIDMKK